MKQLFLSRWLAVWLWLGVLNVSAPAAITDGLSGFWRLDETAGTNALNRFGTSAAAQLRGYSANASWITGRFGGALALNGVSQWGVVTNYTQPTNAFSISLWAWAEARPSWASLVKNWGDANSGQMHLGLESESGDLSAYISTTNSVVSTREGAGTPFPLGSWQHVVLVADGSQLQLYRNGQPVGTPADYSGPILNNTLANLAFGVKLNDAGLAASTVAPGFWAGRLDEIALWTRALTATEIAALEQSPLPLLLDIQRVGDDLQLSWAALGGSSYAVEAAPSFSGSGFPSNFTDLAIVPVFGDGVMATNYLDNGSATNLSARFYRVRLLPCDAVPFASRDYLEAYLNTVSPIDVLANDTIGCAGTTLRITSISGLPENGEYEISPNGLTLLYTPIWNNLGGDQFGYVITDNLGRTASSTVRINVINRPPVANNVTVSVQVGHTVELLNPVPFSDPDSFTTVTFTPNLAGLVHGIATSSLNTIQHTATYLRADQVWIEKVYSTLFNASSVGTDVVPYTVSDGTLSAIGFITIRITP